MSSVMTDFKFSWPCTFSLGTQTPDWGPGDVDELQLTNISEELSELCGDGGNVAKCFAVQCHHFSPLSPLYFTLLYLPPLLSFVRLFHVTFTTLLCFFFHTYQRSHPQPQFTSRSLLASFCCFHVVTFDTFATLLFTLLYY
jgi:hypothetical protein